MYTQELYIDVLYRCNILYNICVCVCVCLYRCKISIYIIKAI